MNIKAYEMTNIETCGVQTDKGIKFLQKNNRNADFGTILDLENEMKYIKKEVNDGSIILMHDIHKTSVDSLNTVLKWLKKHHYEVVTVSELAAIKGVELDKGVYCNIK